MRPIKRKVILNISLAILTLINIIIFIRIRVYQNTNKPIEPTIAQSRFPNIQDPTDDDYIGRSCPELTFSTLDGAEINLRELIGNVIIIKFSKFFRPELSNLAYLEHLANKFSSSGLHLIFISYFGRIDIDAVKSIFNFSSPVVADQNGEIVSVFNASPEEIIIIDRAFKIRTKINMERSVDRATIYSDLISILYSGETP